MAAVNQCNMIFDEFPKLCVDFSRFFVFQLKETEFHIDKLHENQSHEEIYQKIDGNEDANRRKTAPTAPNEDDGVNEGGNLVAENENSQKFCHLFINFQLTQTFPEKFSSPTEKFSRLIKQICPQEWRSQSDMAAKPTRNMF
jgi:hypothetical protein